jgi:hypothetical protein
MAALALGAGIGIAAGMMAAMGGGDDDGDKAYQQFLDDQAKQQQAARMEAAQQEADRALNAPSPDVPSSSSSGKNPELAALLEVLSRDSKNGAGSGSSAPVYTPPAGGLGSNAPPAYAGAMDLRLHSCFRMPGRQPVLCLPGAAQLCLNMAGQPLPCP